MAVRKTAPPVSRSGAGDAGLPVDALLVGRSSRSWLVRWPWLHGLYWGLHSLTWDQSLLHPRAGERLRASTVWLGRHVGEGACVLDLACATGGLASALAEDGFAVVGLDLSASMLRRARAKAGRTAQSVVFLRADFNAGLPFRDRTFDAAVCIGGLDCVADPLRFLGEAARVLRSGGVLLVAVVHARPSGALRGTASGCFFGALRALPGWSGRVRFCTKAELVRLLHAAGFDVLEEGGLAGLTAILARKRPPTAPSIVQERR